MIYIVVMRVQYTHIKRWDTFTNCECVGGDIVQTQTRATLKQYQPSTE